MAELSTMLKRFYVEARGLEKSVKEDHTVAALFKVILSGLGRRLSGSLRRKPFNKWFNCVMNLWEGYKRNKPLSGLLVCRLIMFLCERLSSKSHTCPRSLASRPNVHFSDNLSVGDIISRHTSRLKGFIN